MKSVDRYDPSATLSARARTARTSAPPKFKRVVHRTDPLAPSPMVKWKNEEAENRWRPIDTYPSLHSEKLHKTKQHLFSRIPPLCNSAGYYAERVLSPSLPVMPSSSVTSALDGPNFRPRTSDPLLAYLESSWKANDLIHSKRNEVRTRTQKSFFDSPSRVTRPITFDQAELDARMLLEASQRTKSSRDQSSHGRRHAKSVRHLSPEALKSTPPPTLQQVLIEDELALCEEIPTTHPERVLTHQRKQNLPRALDEGNLTESNTIQARIKPPHPSYLYHPHSNFYRHIPGKSPHQLISDLKRERDWNEAHCLTNAIEGW